MHSLKGKNPVISILLPFKDEEAFLEECIESILEQTYAHWELILVDDHSSDQSPLIALKAANKDPRIRSFLNRGSGVIEALQTAYSQSTGSLISRMDADDIKTVDNLDRLKNRVAPGTIAVGQVKYFREGGIGAGYEKYASWLNALSKEDAHFSMIYKECVIPSPCWMAYRTDLDKAGGFDSNIYPEDYDLCFRFYRAGLSVKGTSEIIHLWRDYANRSSRTSAHYADNLFLELKTGYFIEIDHNTSKELVLWGAGKKAKAIARLLTANQTLFIWITSNSKKIGHRIYDNILVDSASFKQDENQQIIVAVSDVEGQLEIKKATEASPAQVFWFC